MHVFLNQLQALVGVWSTFGEDPRGVWFLYLPVVISMPPFVCRNIMADGDMQRGGDMVDAAVCGNG